MFRVDTFAISTFVIDLYFAGDWTVCDLIGDPVCQVRLSGATWTYLELPITLRSWLARVNQAIIVGAYELLILEQCHRLSERRDGERHAQNHITGIDIIGIVT